LLDFNSDVKINKYAPLHRKYEVVGEMPVYIMYFNLKDGVQEEEFVKKTKEWLRYTEGKIEGVQVESSKLYRHHYFGANPRVYQLHIEFADFSTWDKFTALINKDTKCAKLLQEWQNLFDFNTHYDEFVREIPL